jgi:hypothetical protein
MGSARTHGFDDETIRRVLDSPNRVRTFEYDPGGADPGGPTRPIRRAAGVGPTTSRGAETGSPCTTIAAFQLPEVTGRRSTLHRAPVSKISISMPIHSVTLSTSAGSLPRENPSLLQSKNCTMRLPKRARLAILGHWSGSHSTPPDKRRSSGSVAKVQIERG